MTRALLSLVVPLLLLLASAPAQDRLAITGKFTPATAKPGDEVTLEVTIEIEPGYHVYGKKDSETLKLVDVDAGGLARAGEVDWPDGERHEVFGIVNFWVLGKPVLKQRFKVPATAKPGALKYSGALDYLVCNESSCDPPAKTPFDATLTIAAGGAAPQQPANGEPTKKPSIGLGGIGKPTGANGKEVAITARLEPATARPGERVVLIVSGEVAEPWHTYGSQETAGVPITVRLKDADKLAGLSLRGGPIVPPGDLKDEGGIQQFWITGKFELVQELLVAADAAPGERALAGVVPYSVCDENTCYGPFELPLAIALKIEAGAARPEFTPAKTATDVPPIKPAPGAGAPKPPVGSLWLLLLSCVGGGLFALAMPCTYPMIPITFSFFTKQAEKRGGSVLPLAITYGVGIVAMFVLVGVLLSAVIVDIVNHWITNAVIFASFLAFAAALFGWITLQPPQFLQRAAGNASRGGGIAGVFFMGATLVLTSFTCTAPIVGTLIANVAQEGPLRVGLGMAVFGLTMALPFVALALVPTRVKQIPRSGEWMETLKISLGFVELAAAFKFLSQIDLALGWQLLPRELFLLIWAAIFGLWAMYLFGILRKAGTPSEGVSNARMASGMLVTLFATYFLFGAMGNKLDYLMTQFVPPYSNAIASTSSGKGGHSEPPYALVKDDAVTAVALAKRDDKLLLYNFTGFN